MKNVRIKDSKVIAVWYVGQEADYEDQYSDYDEDIQVDDSREVYPGMVKSGTKRISFKTVPDPEMVYQDKKHEARQVIKARYSDTDQANLTQASVQVVGKMVLEQRPPTAEEQEVLTAANDAKEFINAVLNELHTNKDQADFSQYA